MLAYVFWHTPDSGTKLAAYAAALVDFHAALASEPPAGFLGSFSSQTLRLPWLDADVAYEDWYLLADSAALDSLDVAAVDARRRDAHGAAARSARMGVAGLYKLLGGEPGVPCETLWFAKPEGTTYAEFGVTLDVVKRGGATLWQRRMTLGPTPEFAAQTRTTVCIDSPVRIAHVPVPTLTAPRDRGAICGSRK